MRVTIHWPNEKTRTYNNMLQCQANALINVISDMREASGTEADPVTICVEDEPADRRP